MRNINWPARLAMAAWLAMPLAASAQMRPYIGYVYPAGGQQGTTFQVRLGGQGLDDLNRACVTGPGVTVKVVEYARVLGAQELTLLNEQLKALKSGKNNTTSAMTASGTSMTMTAEGSMTSTKSAGEKTQTNSSVTQDRQALRARLEKRASQVVNRPASVALANLAYIEVTIAPDATPGERELRLITPRGVSNPLAFHVGQLPEYSREPMVTAPLQVLGKEEQALRKRPVDQAEDRVTLPCTLNGQIASGELNYYRFAARKGQQLVINTLARQLIPYIADAVPGWFQPVLALRDAHGKEVAYDDDFRFKPDPTILYQVPADGEYVLSIYDAIYRGREDFVYRITIGENPFATSLFPLGAKAGALAMVKAQGWNLGSSVLKPPGPEAGPGVYSLTATNNNLVSNPLPFALDTLPESFEKEPNNTLARAQKVTLPIIINGRIDRQGDWDVFRFNGRSNQTLVAEVLARRLDSPLDSVLKLTDAKGKLLAYNDDSEDLAAGINTHDADSYLMTKLPAGGTYYVHLGDTARHAGPEYGYRLRLSEPRPDFALRVVPSSVSLRSKSTTTVSVYVIRKDGFTGPIKLSLKDPQKGFSATQASLVGTQTVARLNLKTDLLTTEQPINLTVAGSAKIQEQDVTHDAVPAEDRMQAFLWRHLVPAAELKAVVYDPNFQPPLKRIPPPRPPVEVAVKTETPSADAAASKPKFSKQQVAGRLRQLKLLYGEGLLTDEFYDEKVTECEAVR